VNRHTGRPQHRPPTFGPGSDVLLHFVPVPSLRIASVRPGRLLSGL
jgi:hypothetical protein